MIYHLVFHKLCSVKLPCCVFPQKNMCLLLCPVPKDHQRPVLGQTLQLHFGGVVCGERTHHSVSSSFFLPKTWVYIHGVGSIPINTMFSGMNIHKSQLFWCELQVYYWFWHTATLWLYFSEQKIVGDTGWILQRGGCPHLQPAGAWRSTGRHVQWYVPRRIPETLFLMFPEGLPSGNLT